MNSPTRGVGINGRISSDSCSALAIEEGAVSSNGTEVTSGVSSANVERITAANESASVGGMVEGIDPISGERPRQ